MKVLINIVNLSKSGGVAKIYKALENKFNREVEYFTIGSRNRNCNLVKNIWRLVNDYFKFSIKLIRHQYDIIQINPSLNHKSILRDGLFLLIAKIFNKKVIVFFHGWNNDFERILENKYLWVFKLFYFRSNAIIVLANEFKNILLRWGYSKEIFLETNFIEDNLLNKFNENCIRKRINKKNNNLIILFLARVEKDKGIYEAIDSYELLKKRFMDLKMVIAGDGCELANVKKYILRKELEGIKSVGYVTGEKKKNILMNSDFYIFPTSHGEGMPISVLEAMAFGLPIVTRSVGGLKDFFKNGKMGFITQSKTPKIFTNFIQKLILDEDLRYKIGLYNYKYSRKHFLSSEAAKRLEDVWRSVL